MKTAKGVGILLGLALVSQSYGQGFVTFNNIGNPIIDGVSGEPLGAGWTVELVVGGRVLASTPIVGGGTFLGPEPVDLGTVDAVDVSIRAYPDWLPDFETAVSCVVVLEPITFSAQGGNVNASPPEVPRSLGFPGGSGGIAPLGFQFGTCIPEPTNVALGAVGIGIILGRRRSRKV